MTRTRGTRRKEYRLELRLERERRLLLDQAAPAAGSSTSAYVLEHATLAAQQALADRSLFVLPADRWDAFAELLDRPEQPVEGLAAFPGAPVDPRAGVTSYAPVEPLTADHERSTFDCGSQAQSEWLRHHALLAEQADTARVYVIRPHGKRRVAGYYALSAGAVAPIEGRGDASRVGDEP